jgi:hypothetical protein
MSSACQPKYGSKNPRWSDGKYLTNRGTTMRLDEIQASAAQEQRATTLKANADSQKIKASQAKLQADVASGQLKTQKAKQKNADAKSLRPIKPIVPSAG